MKKKIYSALIGIGLVSLTLGIWGGVTMYKNRQATELIIQARNEERQKAEAESQTAAEEEIINNKGNGSNGPVSYTHLTLPTT